MAQLAVISTFSACGITRWLTAFASKAWGAGTSIADTGALADAGITGIGIGAGDVVIAGSPISITGTALSTGYAAASRPIAVGISFRAGV
jgi:hypothetical protein